mmetsp:Transcript_39585/g.112257  ORF Transcript_39585/g.112257 Transcript_39585/m.112257 type:complete len:207 (+) Transcript_39585:92-712(+)
MAAASSSTSALLRRLARPRAWKFASACCTVAAPDNTTGVKSCSMTQASATASTVLPCLPANSLSSCISRAVFGDSLRGVSWPLATASLMTMSRPACRASISTGPTLCSRRFHVACTQSKRSLLSGPRISRAFLSVMAWAVPDRVRPIRHPRSAFRAASLSSTSPFVRTPDSSVAEWIWYRFRCLPRYSSVSPACVMRLLSVCSFTS